jgi:hypothetical protein
MNPHSERYHAYLLRLWLVEGNEKRILRASLENIHTGEKRGFSNVEALTAFLHELEQWRSERSID